MSKLVAMKSEILGRIFKKAETEQYPFVKPEMPDNYRGAIEFDWKNCKMCGLCARACPAEAIEMLPVSEKRKAPLFYQDRCIYCGQCAEVCPPKVIHLGKNIENSDFERKKIRVDHIQKIADMLKRREAEKPKVTQ